MREATVIKEKFMRAVVTRVLSASVTIDGKKSAHYENTILVTDGEPEILTL